MCQIKTNGYDIMKSGYVMSWQAEPIEFRFAEQFIVRINVLSNSENKPSIHTDVIDGKILNINFINPNLILNFGTSEPFQLGTLNNKNVYANFRVNTFGKDKAISSYGVMYTFYQRSE